MNKQFDRSTFVFKNTYNEYQDSCLICLEPCSHPVVCNRCSTKFCRQCASEWNQSHKVCPKRCSESCWEFKAIKGLKVQLRCPFNNQNCKRLSPEQFDVHYQSCPKAPKELKCSTNTQRLRKEYLCKYEHKLTYMGQKYFTYTVCWTCAQCGQRRTSKSICLECKDRYKEKDFVYCLNCRTPPITQSTCPQRHPIRKKTSQLYGLTCETCELAVNKVCYHDEVCVFSLCTACYLKLPEDPSIPRQREVELEIIEDQEEEFAMLDD